MCVQKRSERCWYRGLDQLTGRSGQRSMNEELKEGAWLEPGLALLRKKVKDNWTEKHRKLLPGRFSWKVGGRKRDCSRLAGRMLVNVKHANWRKAQKGTGCTTVQNGTKSGGQLRRPSESGEQNARTSKKEWKWQRGIVAHPLSESPWNRGNFRMKIWESEKHQSWCLQVEGLRRHVCNRRLSSGYSWKVGEHVVGQWCSRIMMRSWGGCMGCVARWRQNLRSSAPSRGRGWQPSYASSGK